MLILEPDPQNHLSLEINLALNPELASRVELVPVALWNQPTTLTFFGGHLACSRVDSFGEVASLKVRAESLDSLLTERGINRLDLVKMDIEGAEVEVIAAAAPIYGAAASPLHCRFLPPSRRSADGRDPSSATRLNGLPGSRRISKASYNLGLNSLYLINYYNYFYSTLCASDGCSFSTSVRN